MSGEQSQHSSALAGSSERAAVVLLFCLLKLLHCPGVTGCTGHSHSLQWSEQLILPFQGVSFCHADRFLFLCRQIQTFLRFKTLFLRPALLSSHTPVPSFLAHLSLPSACVGCPDYLRFLPPVMSGLLSPSCLLEAIWLLVKLHFWPFLFFPFRTIISYPLPGSSFHLILLLIFRFLCQTCLLFFAFFQYFEDSGTTQRQQKYWS